jgi:type VI protein secretion system component Hcp
MRVNAPEIISSRGWSLAGSVTTPAHLLKTGNTLQLIRPFGSVTSLMWAAMSKKSILPNVVLNTPSGKITLVNAKVVRIGPHFPRFQSSQGAHAKSQDSSQLEEISFTFEKIVIENLFGSMSASNDWM